MSTACAASLRTGKLTFAVENDWAMAITSSHGSSLEGPVRSIGRPTIYFHEFLTIRECRVRVEQAGFRVKILIIATTLLDVDEFTKSDLAQLYRVRWNAELDLRSLKQTMQMEVLRCKTPELVRKEIWTHILAYNLIRTIMAQAATKHGIEPRSISFKGAIQTLEAFQPVIAIQGQHDSAFRNAPVPAIAGCHRRFIASQIDPIDTNLD